MPQINPREASTVSRAIATDKKSVRERLYEKFKPSQFVRVKNIDDEAYEWQFMPAEAEIENQEDGGATHAIYGRQGFNSNYTSIIPGNEQIWSIEAGASEVLLGENAYLFIDGLYKRIVAKRAIAKKPDIAPSQARNFNWTDGNMQEQIINEIFLGIENPRFQDVPTTQKQAVK
jgi:hypothetical protein